MVTNKKLGREWVGVLLLATMVAWLAGCTPAGPRALLRGKRLIEKGEYTDAVDQLKTATALLPTNALAWNYLGLAYHHAGQPAHAEQAYERALRLNHDLNLNAVLHYNLGCLLLEENRPETLDGARNELYAYVLHQGNSVDGWLKLGTAQLRLAEFNQAEASFKQVLHLSPQNAEALNDLGVIQLQRHRHRDAVGYFDAALKCAPNYAPALLNLAVTDGYLNNPSASLQKYREYLELSPRPANWEAVNTIAKQLEQQLTPQPPATSPNTVASAPPPPTNNPARPVATVPTNVARPETLVSTSHPAPPPLPKPPVETQQTTRPEVVKLPESPSIQTAGQSAPATPANPPSTVASSDVQVVTDAGETPEETRTPRHGFFQKLNPMGLFHHKTKGDARSSSQPQMVASTDIGDGRALNPTQPDGVSQSSTPASRPVVSVPRYPYLSPGRPPAGNRAKAEQLVSQGQEADRDQRFRDALNLYRAATHADPSYFEAQSSLGLAALDSGELPESLRAYEMALAIKPGSFSARYNFGLALKKANYILDAAQELERLLASNPVGEPASHIAMVHLTLANLYAEQFHQPTAARVHYLKVLELDPHNTQATAIRYWLQDNG